MAWYKTGTVTIDNNIVVGVGTSWGKSIYGIGAGQILLVPGSGTVQIFEIASVDNDTQITLVAGPAAAITNSTYAILSFYGGSYADFGRQLSSFLAQYQELLGVWQQFLTGTEDINLTLPDGSVMVLKSLSEIESAAATAGEAAVWYEDNKAYLEQSGANATAAATSAASAQQSVDNIASALNGTLKSQNNLSEIAAGGDTAKAAARDNIGAIDGTGLLAIGNNLSEIAAAGTDAQASARENLGIQPADGALLAANRLSEIAAAGADAQGEARTNLGAQQAGTSLQTENNLSEIAAAGTDAQLSARNNLGITLDAGALLTVNNLSEIAAEGSSAQSSARANLGITASGNLGGELLGIQLITISGTYNLATGCNYIIAEMVGGGGLSGTCPATGTATRALSDMGSPGGYLKIYIPVAQLSTASTNQIIITIGAGGTLTGGANNGGNTTIDTNVAVAGGGAIGPNGVSFTNASGGFATCPQATVIRTTPVVSAAISSNILESKDYLTFEIFRPSLSIWSISATSYQLVSSGTVFSVGSNYRWPYTNFSFFPYVGTSGVLYGGGRSRILFEYSE
ncbi:hypothetical protein ABK905_09465 [Acerihabitans sp. KWT182]|uniref:DUF1983 domain-containing protein n=1 Tax=Acerihabitans sp. KWT182 TaxID=3157919 RepID=A0AAU7QD46_9GAMM